MLRERDQEVNLLSVTLCGTSKITITSTIDPYVFGWSNGLWSLFHLSLRVLCFVLCTCNSRAGTLSSLF